MNASGRNKLSYSEIYALEKSLGKENRRLFEDLCDYIDTAPIAIEERLNVKWDILQMFLDGERCGRGAEDIIGEDYEAFCQSVIAALPRLAWRNRLINKLCDVVLAVIFYLAFELIGHILEVLKDNADVWSVVLMPQTTAEFFAMLLIIHVARYYYARQELHGTWRDQLGPVLLLAFAAAVCGAFAGLVPTLQLHIPLMFYLLVLLVFVLLVKKMLKWVQ